jgi:hypothetical protein
MHEGLIEELTTARAAAEAAVTQFLRAAQAAGNALESQFQDGVLPDTAHALNDAYGTALMAAGGIVGRLDEQFEFGTGVTADAELPVEDRVEGTSVHV